MALYPLKLTPVIKTPLWSGERLARFYGKKGASEIGESWELTVRKDAASTVENGPLCGTSLALLIEERPKEIMGKTPFINGRFPLLIKLIDAKEPLSVQVHPNDELAALLENDSGKTELWHIVEATEEAYILYGLKEGVSKEEAASALQSADFARVMRRVPVHKGETYFIPAGLAHAIGEGVLLAEVQQNSDLTYRLYDYNRKDKDGKTRPLHIEKGQAALSVISEKEIEDLRFSLGKEPREGGVVLANTPYFYAEALSLSGKAPLYKKEYLRHLLCLDGKAILTHLEETLSIQKGESVLLPASLSDCLLEGEGDFLISALV